MQINKKKCLVRNTSVKRRKKITLDSLSKSGTKIREFEAFYGIASFQIHLHNKK